MPTLAQIPDFVNGMLPKVKKGAVNQMVQQVTDYVGFKRIIEGGGIAEQTLTGRELQFQAWLRNDNAVTFNAPTASRSGTAPRQIDLGTVRIGYSQTSWVYNVYEEFLNQGAERVISVIKMRRAKTFLDMVESWETVIWGLTPATDTIRPFGLQNFITSVGATATFGQNGTNPTGYSDVHGIDASDPALAGWANWNATYAAVTTADLVRSVRQAFRRTRYGAVPMVTLTDHGVPRTERFGTYTNETVLQALEELREGTNQNLEFDTMAAYGKIRSNGLDMTYVPTLDDDARNPVYILDWKYIHAFIVKGDFMREKGPHSTDANHDNFITDVTMAGNIYCTDRHRQSILTAA